MSLSASVVRELVAAGLAGEALISACERIEAASGPAPAPRSKRQERNARYYQAHKGDRLNKSSERLKTSETLSNKEKSPAPSKEINSPPTQEPLVPSLGRAREKRGLRLPEDWRPSDEARAFAVSELGNSGAKHEFEKFCDHFRARAGPNGRKLDWDATWRNWVRKAAEDGKKPQHSGRQRGSLSDFAATFAQLAQERANARNGGSDDLRGSSPNGSAESRPQITLRSIDGGVKAVNE
jgi:hypothetical protein